MTKKKKPIDLKLGFVCLARKAFDFESARKLAEISKSHLQSIATALVIPDDFLLEETQQALRALRTFQEKRIDALLIQCGTFASAELVMIWAQHLDVPIIIWTVPELGFEGYLRLNSLVGGNAITSALYKLGYQFKFYYDDAEDPTFYQKLSGYLRVISLVGRLKSMRIGLIGSRPQGFQDIAVDELELRKKIGVHLQSVDLSELSTIMNHISEKDVKEFVAPLAERYHVSKEITNELDAMGKLYYALKKLTQEYQLDALAVRCLPELYTLHGLLPCGTLSFLTDEGLMTSCEADVLGTVGMFIQHYLSEGMPPFLADLVSINKENNSGILWHCGVAPVSLSKDSNVRLSSHYIRKKGVTVEFSLKAGPITLARLDDGGADTGYRMLIASGTATGETVPMKGTAAPVVFEQDVQDLLNVIIYQGFPHHFSFVYSEIQADLRELCRFMDIQIVQPQKS